MQCENNNLKTKNNMLQPEEKAIYLFNKALKTIIWNSETNKDTAKQIVLNQLTIVKEFIYDASLLDDLSSGDTKMTMSYIQKVYQIIENL